MLKSFRTNSNSESCNSTFDHISTENELYYQLFLTIFTYRRVLAHYQKLIDVSSRPPGLWSYRYFSSKIVKKKDIFTFSIPSVSVSGDRVEVSFPGRSLMRLELSVDTWELLWELRTSVQTMLYRNLNNPADARTSQDGRLLSLIVELLNSTDSKCLHHGLSREEEVDWTF